MNTVCPNCERFIGSSDECPFCGIDEATPRFLKYFRLTAFCLALFGMAALFAMSFCRDLPLVKAGWITPMMNYAQVRASGKTTNDAFIGDNSGPKQYVSFYLRDNTGELKVAAYGKTAQQLIAEGNIPRKDDHVEVEGRLRISGNGKLTLMLDQLLRVSRSEKMGYVDPDRPEPEQQP